MPRLFWLCRFPCPPSQTTTPTCSHVDQIGSGSRRRSPRMATGNTSTSTIEQGSRRRGQQSGCYGSPGRPVDHAKIDRYNHPRWLTQSATLDQHGDLGTSNYCSDHPGRNREYRDGRPAERHRNINESDHNPAWVRRHEHITVNQGGTITATSRFGHPDRQQLDATRHAELSCINTQIGQPFGAGFANCRLQLAIRN